MSRLIGNVSIWSEMLKYDEYFHILVQKYDFDGWKDPKTRGINPTSRVESDDSYSSGQSIVGDAIRSSLKLQ
jgi:hypothetical protein